MVSKFVLVVYIFSIVSLTMLSAVAGKKDCKWTYCIDKNFKSCEIYKGHSDWKTKDSKDCKALFGLFLKGVKFCCKWEGSGPPPKEIKY